MLKIVTSRAGPVLTRGVGHHMNSFGRGPQGDATYQEHHMYKLGRGQQGEAI